MKKWVLFTMICVFSLVEGGCWDRTEINDLALIMATGVDAVPNKKLKVTIQMALPTGGEQAPNVTATKGGKSYFTEGDTGEDIWGTTTKIQEKLSRKVFTAHRRILVIGEKLAEQGIHPILDAFVRHPESRLRTYVVVAKGATAEKILNVSYPIEKEPTEGIREILHSQIGLAVDLKDVLKDLASNQSVVLPSIELVSNGKPKKQIFQLSGAAVFHHDKLVGYLNDRKTRGLIWLRQEPMQAEMTVYIPQLKGSISADVLKASTDVKAKKVNGQIVMYINALAQVGITENQTTLDLTSIGIVKSIEHLFAEDLKRRINTSLTEIQHKNRSDVIGFGEVIHRTYPQDWKRIKKNWDQEFPNIKVVLQTNVKIKRTGITSRPINIPENQIKKSFP